jgi:archaellum component FlaF (FlaF/FlaG flagellin family)
MSHPSSSRLSLKLAALCLLAACLVYFTSRASSTRHAAAAAQVLTVQVEPQPESPLQITSTKVISSDPFSPSVEFTVTNRGQKRVQAYTISGELVTEGGSRKRAGFTHMASQRDILQPGRSRSDSISEPYSPLPVNSVVLSVDFVELENGDT